MSETVSAVADLGAPDDLISFLNAIPDARYRRGVRYPQWFLLLVAVLGILSGWPRPFARCKTRGPIALI